MSTENQLPIKNAGGNTHLNSTSNDNALVGKDSKMFGIRYRGIENICLISCILCNAGLGREDPSAAGGGNGSSSNKNDSTGSSTAAASEKSLTDEVNGNVINQKEDCIHENEIRKLFNQYGSVTEIDFQSKLCYFKEKEAVAKVMSALNGITLGDYIKEREDLNNLPNIKRIIHESGNPMIAIEVISISSYEVQRETNGFSGDNDDVDEQALIESFENVATAALKAVGIESDGNSNKNTNADNHGGENRNQLSPTDNEKQGSQARPVLCNCQTKNATAKYKGKYIKIKHIADCPEMIAQRFKAEKRLSYDRDQSYWTDVDEAELIRAVLDDYKHQRNTYEDCADNIEVSTTNWKEVSSKLSKKRTMDDIKSRWRSIFAGTHRETKCVFGDRLLKRPEPSTDDSTVAKPITSAPVVAIATAAAVSLVHEQDGLSKNSSSSSKSQVEKLLETTGVEVEDTSAKKKHINSEPDASILKELFRPEDDYPVFYDDIDFQEETQKKTTKTSSSKKLTRPIETMKEKISSNVRKELPKPSKPKESIIEKHDKIERQSSYDSGYTPTAEVSTYLTTSISKTVNDPSSLRNDPWSLAEDDLLRKLVSAFGPREWEKIAMVFEYKHSPESCAFRWSYIGDIIPKHELLDRHSIENSSIRPHHYEEDNSRYGGRAIGSKKTWHDHNDYENISKSKKMDWDRNGGDLSRSSYSDEYERPFKPISKDFSKQSSASSSQSRKRYNEETEKAPIFIYHENNRKAKDKDNYDQDDADADEIVSLADRQLTRTPSNSTSKSDYVNRWAPEEDERLTRMILEHRNPPYPWEEFAMRLGTGRTVGALKSRYGSVIVHNINLGLPTDDALKPSISATSSSSSRSESKSNKKWTEREKDILFQRAFGEKSPDWESIAQELGNGRTATQCKATFDYYIRQKPKRRIKEPAVSKEPIRYNPGELDDEFDENESKTSYWQKKKKSQTNKRKNNADEDDDEKYQQQHQKGETEEEEQTDVENEIIESDKESNENVSKTKPRSNSKIYYMQ